MFRFFLDEKQLSALFIFFLEIISYNEESSISFCKLIPCSVKSFDKKLQLGIISVVIGI
ncbi:uncharacterized protein METZ01_LOCUS363708, partial [marine metagenome]